MDLRRIPLRDNTAALSLKGKLEAASYVEGKKYIVISSIAPVRKAVGSDTMLETQALSGEIVTVYGKEGEWVWGQLDRDGYVGYLPAASLAELPVQSNGDATCYQQGSHRICIPAVHVYAEPDIKSKIIKKYFLNARVAGTDLVEGSGTSCQFLALKEGGYIIERHVAEQDEFVPDFVDMALKFVSTPYLWGGKTYCGIDCSGLVQVSLQAAGFADIPRDADMQEAELGTSVAFDDSDGLQRGDLVFWSGHVGIMTDESHMLHANAYHMQVAQESLWKASFRISAAGGDVTAVRRMPLSAF